jgi:hypothetical protein
MVDRPITRPERAATRRRVVRGAMLLDRADVGWACRVDLDRLDMASQDNDVLGQLYGSFMRGYAYLMRYLPAGVPYAASGFGFTGRADTVREYDALDREWADAVRRRLGG